MSAKLDKQADKLYQLIWRRTLASQMAPAELDRTTATIAVEGSDYLLTASGQILRFDGFLKIVQENLNDVLLPELAVGSELELVTAQVTEKFSKPASPFRRSGLGQKSWRSSASADPAPTLRQSILFWKEATSSRAMSPAAVPGAAAVCFWKTAPFVNTKARSSGVGQITNCCQPTLPNWSRLS